MNLNYIIKRCKGFGYASTLKDVKLKSIGYKSPQIFYIKDASTHSKPKDSIVIKNLDEFLEQISSLSSSPLLSSSSFDLSKPSIFLVELGVPTTTSRHDDIDVSNEEAESLIDSFDISLDIDSEKKIMYKNALKEIRKTPETYLKAEFNATFLKFLVEFYPRVKETKLQRSILKILVKNQVRVDQLISEHPLNYKEVPMETVRQSTIFQDVKISDSYFEKSKTELEDDNNNGVLREFSSQAITKFNGFGNMFAQVDNSKKRASLDDISVLRNHANIHALARNKIIATPQVLVNCSFSKLMKIFSKFENFAVVFIWPNYGGSGGMFTFSESPAKTLEVDVGDGNVILAVVFRYMLIHFFGLHSTISHTDYFQKYLL